MSRTPDALTFSATDLSHFVACAQLALLNHAVKCGAPKPPTYADPALEVLRLRGLEHERQYEERLRDEGLEIHRIAALPPSPDSWERYTAATLGLMRQGVDVIVQGGLALGPWVGKPDFLRKVQGVSATAWAYDVVDTKLARHAKAGALLQVLLYADLVERVYGVPPLHVHLALGGPELRTERKYAP
jgi:predicted RecB family nuclease